MLTRMSDSGREHDPRRRAILDTVRAVPAGVTLGYGRIAMLAGLPGRARWVARLLAECDDPALPWHRVVRGDARIAFPPGSPGFFEQRRRLRAEGIVVSDDGRVAGPRAGDLDALLWGPGDVAPASTDAKRKRHGRIPASVATDEGEVR